ncbi:replication protein [Malikia granosa]|uniref:Replication protein n=2 Tax=Malikia granosa TaxID=263067 RepID=A0A2S9K046_9BURK|nr:replication protein [Malikia granosa]
MDGANMSALKKNDDNLFSSWIEPAHYLRSDSRTAYFSLLTQPEGMTAKRQRSYPVDSMGFVLAECDKSIDTWISQAEFWAPTRRLLHFMRVGLLFVDLDTYKLPELAGLSAEAQLERLLRLCETAGLPQPSLVIFSGRGLQAKWLLDAPLPARALPRWSLVQREIGRRLVDLGSDANALDASRVLRLVHTVNSKSGEVVRVVHNTGTRYDFDKLADSLLEFTREQLTKLREDRAAREADPTQTKQRPATRTKGHLTAIDTAALSNLRPFIGAQLAWDRLHDLRKLADLRGWTKGAPDGSRDLAVFVGASFLAQAVPNVPRFYDELRVLGREFAPHWTASMVNGSASAVIDRMKRLAKGEKVEFNGHLVDPRYRWRNDTLIQRFGITPDEERQLATIVSRGEAARRHAEREAQRRAEQRDAAGGPTRAEYLATVSAGAEQKRATARLLRAQGKSWAEVAAEVGYKSAEVARKSCA